MKSSVNKHFKPFEVAKHGYQHTILYMVVIAVYSKLQMSKFIS